MRGSALESIKNLNQAVCVELKPLQLTDLPLTHSALATQSASFLNSQTNASISLRHLPDKALDLVDEAGAQACVESSLKPEVSCIAG